MSEPTKRELELELELWKARIDGISNGVAALNAQGQLLQLQAREAREHVARLEAALKALPKEPDDAHQQTAAAKAT